MRNRSDVLELAVLGLLHSAPMHGYQLRKRLNEMLGMLRPFSYGSLYPCLKSLAAKTLIESSDEDSGPTTPRRGRIVYRLTGQGNERLESLLGQAGPATWEDENFDVRFALFAQTDAETRLRILEGRRARMAERLDSVNLALRRGAPADEYSQELQRHALEQVEREVRWLEGMIDRERARRGAAPALGPTTQQNISKEHT
ncbi:MAG: PadR family transcriptional regulator [Bifidobacteriaceae bacterium]|nr:PadR family transcriptional regulator [Bifidobacteriaceae bacterium]